MRQNVCNYLLNNIITKLKTIYVILTSSENTRNGVKVNFSYCATHANLRAAAAPTENTEYANNAVNEIRTVKYHVRNAYATHKKPSCCWDCRSCR